MRRSIASIPLLLALSACTVGQPATLGLDQPLRVTNGTLKDGDLPGDVVPDGGPPVGPDGGVELANPHVTTANSLSNLLRPGEVGKAFSGGISDDGVAIGVRFADIGTGYWVIPAGGTDPSTPGTLTWSMQVDISPTAAPGLHPLVFAAIDDAGHAGTQFTLPTCITSPFPYPSNLNACDPTIKPPAAVLSLTWDTNVDLDLELVTPDGTVVSPKHPATNPDVDGGPPPDPTKDGVLDRDSNGNCIIDGQRREDIIWQNKPASGGYLVYVNMFSACGLSAAHFTVTLYLSSQSGANYSLVNSLQASGELTSFDANGGAALGLFLTQYRID